MLCFCPSDQSNLSDNSLNLMTISLNSLTPPCPSDESALSEKTGSRLWLVFIESRRGQIKRLDLGNLNPIYERELNKPNVHQMKGRWNVSNDGEGGAKDVGISNWRGSSPLSETRGVREVSAAGHGDGVAKADGSLMSPEVLRPASAEGISARLSFPHIGLVR